MKIIGWCDPYWRATTPCPHTWHAYQDDKCLSCCGKWYWDDDDDMDPMPSPPEGAKVCKTCAKLAALEAAQSSGGDREMKPTLKWKNGRCTNPPPEWCVEAISRVDGTWVVWVQQSRSNVVLASHSIYELPSQEAAQLACEVALWRLGVLPLPEWQPVGSAGGMSTCELTQLGITASMYPAATLAYWKWSVAYDGGMRCRGGAASAADAKQRIEPVLRALIAAALEAK